MGKYTTLIDDKVLAALTRAADQSLACPGNDELAGLAGVIGSATASGSVKRLERTSRIIVERGNSSRVVTIVATGRKTAGTISAPHWRDRGGGANVGGVDAGADPARRRRPAPLLAAIADATLKEYAPLDREPCVRCGVRGDIGCSHTASRLTASCFV